MDLGAASRVLTMLCCDYIYSFLFCRLSAHKQKKLLLSAHDVVLTMHVDLTDFIWKLFTTAAFRVTGKKTNPHLVRDMIVVSHIDLSSCLTG